MNFIKYESEILSFLNDNFENLKRRKVSNSEMAFKDLLATEHKDTNNAIRNIMKKVVSAARTEFVQLTDEIQGYEIGEQYKKVVKVPQLDIIKAEFNPKVSTNLRNSATQRQQSSQKRIESFQSKSPINNEKKSRAAQFAGGAAGGTMLVVAPLLKTLTQIGIGTNLLITGFSAIVIGGIVYTICSIQEENGKKRQVVFQQSKNSPGASQNVRKQTVKSTMDKASVSNMLDARKVQAEREVKNAIRHAEAEYKKMIAQLNI